MHIEQISCKMQSSPQHKIEWEKFGSKCHVAVISHEIVSARLSSMPGLFFGASSFASNVGRAIMSTSSSKGGYLAWAARAKAAESSRYPFFSLLALERLREWHKTDYNPHVFDEMHCLELCNQQASSGVQRGHFTLWTWPTQSAMATKNWKGHSWLSDSSQILLEMSSPKHNFLNKSSSDSKWVWCRPMAVLLLSIWPISEALKSNGLGFRWFQKPSDIRDC